MPPNLVIAGISGVGTSAIAILLKQAGYRISGCDIRHSKITDTLRTLDIEVRIEQNGETAALALITPETRALLIPDAFPPNHPLRIKTLPYNKPVWNKNRVLLDLLQHTDSRLIPVIGDQNSAKIAYIIATQKKCGYCIGAKPINETLNARFDRHIAIEISPHETFPEQLLPYCEYAVFSGLNTDEHWDYYNIPLQNFVDIFKKNNIPVINPPKVDNEPVFYAWQQPHPNAIHEIRCHPITINQAIMAAFKKHPSPTVVFRPYPPAFLNPYPPMTEKDAKEFTRNLCKNNIDATYNTLPQDNEFTLYIGGDDLENLIKKREIK